MNPQKYQIYTQIIFKKKVFQKNFNKFAIDVDTSSGNNNDIADTDSFLFNGNLAQGQITVHKIFEGNDPVNAIQYILQHQEYKYK